MKKTNRFIALLTALVLVFSTLIGTTAFAKVNEDVAGTDFEVAVGKLQALKIMEGYPDGTFLPNGEITRAEFAKIAVVAMGLGDAAEASKGATKFADVNSSHWAAGYINLAVSRSLVSGYPDGTYKPEGKITNAEAITILCRLVGLGPVIDKEGTWPANYVGRAANEGILDGVNVASATNATRGLVAKMLVNTLTVDMWGANSYGDDGSVDYGKTGETLLGDKLNVTEAEKVTVVAYDTDDNEISLADLNGDKVDDLEGTFEVAEGTDVDLYEGFLNEVTAWVNDDDEVIFLEVTSKYFIDAIEINEDGDELELLGAEKSYDLSDDLDDLETYLNGDKKDLTADTKYDLAKVVLNSKNDVLYIDAYEFTDFLVIESVDKDVVTDIDEEELDLEDYTIFKDGKLISAEGIEKGDILLFNTEDFAEVYTVSVTGEIQAVYNDAFKVDGTEYEYVAALVDDIHSKYIDEDGDYSDFDKDAAEQMEDEGDVTIFVDREGEALFVTGELGAVQKSTIGGLLLEDVAMDTSFNKGYLEFKFVNEEGKKVTETINVADLEVITYDGDDYEDGEYIPGSTTVKVDKFALEDTGAGDYELVAYYDNGGGSDKSFGDVDDADIDNWFKAGSVVEFTYDEAGDVVEIALVTGSGTKADVNSMGVADADITKVKYIDGYKLTSSTVIFNIEECAITAGPPAVVDYDEDDITVATLANADFKKIEDDNNLAAASLVDTMIYRNDDGEITYIVAAKTDADEDTTDYVAVITEYRENTDDEVIKITAWVDGVKKDYTVDKLNVSITKKGTYFLEIQDEDGLVVDIDTTASEGLDLVSGAIDTTSIDTSNDTFKVGTTEYKLVSDGFIYDEDNKEVKNLRDLRNLKAGNVVDVIRDNAGNNYYVKLIVIRDSGTATVTPPAATTASMTVAAGPITIATGNVASVVIPAGNTDVYTVKATRQSNGNTTTQTIFSPGTTAVTATSLSLGAWEDTLLVQLLKGTEVISGSTIAIDRVVPGTPAGFAAVDDAGATTIALSWTDQSADTDLDHFEIYRNVGSAATDASTVVDADVDKADTTFSFDAAALTNGDDVHFAIYAVDAAGNKVKADVNVTYDTTN